MVDDTTALEEPWQRQRLRVPGADGSLLAIPALRDAVGMLSENHARLSVDRTNIQGRALEHLRRWSREKVLCAARQYTAELTGAAIPEQPVELLAVAGHQPSLFHPGVWVKNFALGELAARAGATGLNLVIDNDTFSSTRIRVPVGTRGEPSIEAVPFDADRPTQPWEDARVVDRELFASFGDRVTGLMSRWEIEPLAAQLWPAAVEHLERSDRLADCLTAARNRVERRWGVENLELPASRLCALDPFLWFASHLLAHLPRFREVHNAVLLQYREVNRIRSRTHPVPELAEREGWYEAPFWMWSAGDLMRKRVFARQEGRRVELSDGRAPFASLPLSPEMDGCCAVEVLRELPERGIHLRTRALTTTLFARLCLGDLFIHGIGGSKYDEMTDRLIARFFELRPPSFLTLSATLYLPLAEPFDVEPQDSRRLQGMLRDLRYNADRHVSESEADAAGLIEEKRRLIAQQQRAQETRQTRSERRRRSRENFERYRQLKVVNERLADFGGEQSERIGEELATVEAQLRANAVLTDREYSFCLYPERKIRAFMERIRLSTTNHTNAHG